MKTPRPSLAVRAAFAALAALALAACAGKEVPAPEGSRWVINVPKTPLYRFGPAQSFGPDYSLTQGQQVIMLRREYGYSRILTEHGYSGYVATEHLSPAPEPEPTPTPSPVKRRAARAGGEGSIPMTEPPTETPGPLPYDEMPLGLPEPEQPPPPAFRY